MVAEVAGPDQRAAKKKRPGHCTKNPSRVSWVDLSRDRYIALPKLAAPAGNIFGRGLLETNVTRPSKLHVPVHASKCLLPCILIYRFSQG